MYDYIKGIYKGISKDSVILDNNGIGYKIFTSGYTMSKLPVPDGEVQLYVIQIVREDFLGLYGFSDREELELFERLTTVNGVGPKSALSLLSISSPENLKKAIVFEEESLLQRAPGIGKKTASRIILELKDIFRKENFTRDESDIQITSNMSEALEALMTLGYTQKEAETVLKTITKSMSVEETIKEALKQLIS